MHTPGPWFTEALSTIGHCAIVDADGFTIANPSPMGMANARLIAAAPALLEALLDALPYVEDVLSDPDALACFKPGTVERHAKAIRAAIAAAATDRVITRADRPSARVSPRPRRKDNGTPALN